jgi:hypothetical protein
MKTKTLNNRLSVFATVSILLCFLVQAVPGGVIANRNSEVKHISKDGLKKAKAKLHIVYFKTAPGLKLACADTTTEINGVRCAANRGAFGNSLHIMTHAFTPRTYDLVKEGKTSWAKLIKTFLDNPGNRHYNVIVCPGGAADQTKEKATAEYLRFMSRLEAEYPNKEVIYMTGALDNARIREFCRANSKILLDSADISGNKAQVEWYLWTRIAEGAEGGSGIFSDSPAGSLKGKSFKQLIADGKRADKKDERVTAYINYREALEQAEDSKDIRDVYSKEIIHIRVRISAIELFPEVKKEKDAWDTYDRSRDDIKSNIERAKQIFENTAEKYPDTYSGKQAQQLAQELANFTEKL